TPDPQGVEAMAEAATAVAATMTALQAPSPLIPSFAPLAARLQVLVDALPEAQWPPLVDDLADDDADDADAAPETPVAEVQELAGIEDLSAYFDPSLLDLPSGDSGAAQAVTGGDEIRLDDVAAELPAARSEEHTSELQ